VGETATTHHHRHDDDDAMVAVVYLAERAERSIGLYVTTHTVPAVPAAAAAVIIYTTEGTHV